MEMVYIPAFCYRDVYKRQILIRCLLLYGEIHFQGGGVFLGINLRIFIKTTHESFCIHLGIAIDK